MLFNVIIVWLWRQWMEHLTALQELQKENVINNIYINDPFNKNIEHIYTSNIIQIHTITDITEYKIDFGIVSTPNILQADIVKILIENGIHILKEKPFFMDSITMNTMLSLAQERSVIIKCAQQREYNGMYSILEKYISQLWQIHLVNYDFTLNDKNNSWYWEQELGWWVFYGLTWHCLHFYIKFFWIPKRFIVKKVNSSSRPWKYNSDDSNFVTLEYQNGMIGSIYTSVVSPAKRESIEIHGSNGTLFLNRHDICVIISWVETIYPVSFSNGYKEQILDFIHLISSEKWTFIDKNSQAILSLIESSL